MNEAVLREMWEQSHGSEAPAAFVELAKEYYRMKRVFCPVEFDVADYAACATIYKALGKEDEKAKDKAAPKKERNG